jgi:hypothetical protein
MSNATYSAGGYHNLTKLSQVEAFELRNTFWREIAAPLNRVVRLPGKSRGYTTEPSGSRERAIGVARQLRALYLADPCDCFISMAWGQCEASAVQNLVINQVRA